MLFYSCIGGIAMQMLIDGKWVDAADGGVNEILDNATVELIETAPHGSALDVTWANEATQRGRRAMAAMPSHERAALIQRAADACRPNMPRSAFCWRARTARRCST